MAGRTRSRWLTGLVGLGLLGLVGLSFGPATAFLGRAGALDWVNGASAPPAGASGSPTISTGRGSSPGSPPTVVPGSSSPGASVAPSPSPERSPRPLLGPRALDRARLVRLVEDFRRRTGSPGLSVAVRWPDGTAWTITSGVADLATGRPVTAATPFAIASVTKTFTAALVLRLVEESRIGLDDPVGPWFPDLDLPAGITVRMLLDHTSGLGDPFLEGAVDRELLADRSAVWTAGRFLAALPKPRFAPGRGWAYSNANYVVLGLLVERLTGRPYAALLESTFFEPLGLSTAIVQPGLPTTEPPAHAYELVTSSGRLRRRDLSDGSLTAPFTSVVTAAGAAGNIAIGALDLARWGAALYGGGVLRPDLLAAMIEDASRTASLRPKIPYGLGVQVVEIAGQPTLGHSGRLLGARAALRYLVRSGITIVVLSNQSRSDVAPLVEGIVRLVLPSPAGCGRCV